MGNWRWVGSNIDSEFINYRKSRRRVSENVVIWKEIYTVYGFDRDKKPADEADYPTLPSGNTEVPFSVHFPSTTNLPQPVKHQYGNIRYTLMAYIDRIRWFDHNTETINLTFDPLTSINSANQTMQNVLNEEVEFFGCCGCSSKGLAQLQATCSDVIMKNGTFPIEIAMQNLSDKVDITRVTVRLVQMHHFKAGSHTKNVEAKMYEVVVPNTEINRGDNTHRKLNFCYEIPGTALVSFSSRLISVSYRIEFNFYFRSAQKKAKLMKNIVVGNMNSILPSNPSQQYQQQFYVGPFVHPQRFDVDYPPYKEIAGTDKS